MKNNWEQISANDALYGIASADEKKNNKWELDDFFKRGEGIINQLMETSTKYGYPSKKDTALDFGCGAGRLLRFTSWHFRQVIGIDISKGMIELAKKYNGDLKNVEYFVNEEPNLHFIADNSVDMVYTFHVLQHIPKRNDRIRFIKEFQRILKPNGLLAFHIPIFLPFRKRIQIKRRLYSILNSLGFSSDFLMNKLSLYPIHMTSISNEFYFVKLN